MVYYCALRYTAMQFIDFENPSWADLKDYHIYTSLNILNLTKFIQFLVQAFLKYFNIIHGIMFLLMVYTNQINFFYYKPKILFILFTGPSRPIK